MVRPSACGLSASYDLFFSGYYGNLADPGTECKRLPLATICDSQGCVCAQGWQAIYNLSLDGNTLTMHCIVECELGEYARINSQSSRLVRLFHLLLADRSRALGRLHASHAQPTHIHPAGKRWRYKERAWTSSAPLAPSTFKLMGLGKRPPWPASV